MSHQEMENSTETIVMDTPKTFTDGKNEREADPSKDN